MRPDLLPGARGIVFRNALDEAVLRYDKLIVRDATGRILPSHLEVTHHEVAIVIDDRGAGYPVVVDPLITTEVAKLTAADAADSDEFGFAVGLSGDTVVVGAHYDDDGGTNSGAAYIFRRNRSGADSWGQVAKLIGADTAAGDNFGVSVAIDGDTVVIGADRDDDAGSSSGVAFVFECNQGGPDAWGQVAKLLGSTIGAADFFGTSVAVSGDTIAVGATGDDDVAINSGIVYIFERNTNLAGGTAPDAWGEVRRIKASDAARDDRFGSSLAISGATLVVGAYMGDVGASTDAGKAYVFERNRGGADAWGEVAQLVASDAEATDWFGTSVAIDGDTLVVGAPLESPVDAGAAYVFERNRGGADVWGEVIKLTAPASTGSSLGSSVAISGETILVGAPRQRDAGADAGAAYVFRRNEGGADQWGQVAQLIASDTTAGDLFGGSVALDGTHIAIGASKADLSAANEGSVTTFRRQGNAWVEAAKVAGADGGAGDAQGYSIGLSGDLLALGAYLHDGSAGADTGAVYLFRRNQGGAGVWGQVGRLEAGDAQVGAQFGAALDVEGDRLLVGAPNQDGRGAAYLFERNQG